VSNNILEIRHLKTYFFTGRGVVKAVDDVNLGLKKGENLCLVGESGCGKTATALSILRLIDSPPGRIVDGEILYHGEDLLKCSEQRLRQIRGNRIAMIFQDPQSSLNPVFTVGNQIAEQVKLHLGLKHKQAMAKTLHLMEQVGIPRAAERMKDYPHQFSGGMKQRVMIAAALSCDPEILIADEPTTALDTTIKAQILDICGRIAEAGTVLDIFDQPLHPYTQGLIDCLPDISTQRDRLTPIPGMIPSLIDPPRSCIFNPRCRRQMTICTVEKPQEVVISDKHLVACHLYSAPSQDNREVTEIAK